MIWHTLYHIFRFKTMTTVKIKNILNYKLFSIQANFNPEIMYRDSKNTLNYKPNILSYLLFTQNLILKLFQIKLKLLYHN